MTLFLALLVMVGVAGVDALYVLYTRHIVARQSIRAASYSGLIHLVNGFVIVQYTEDWRYLLCAAVGSIVGTYLASALPVRRVATVTAWNPLSQGVERPDSATRQSM